MDMDIDIDIGIDMESVFPSINIEYRIPNM